MPTLRFVPGKDENLRSELRHNRSTDVVETRPTVQEYNIGRLLSLGQHLDQVVKPIRQANLASAGCNTRKKGPANFCDIIPRLYSKCRKDLYDAFQIVSGRTESETVVEEVLPWCFEKVFDQPVHHSVRWQFIGQQAAKPWGLEIEVYGYYPLALSS